MNRMIESIGGLARTGGSMCMARHQRLPVARGPCEEMLWEMPWRLSPKKPWGILGIGWNFINLMLKTMVILHDEIPTGIGCGITFYKLKKNHQHKQFKQNTNWCGIGFCSFWYVIHLREIPKVLATKIIKVPQKCSQTSFAYCIGKFWNPGSRQPGEACAKSQRDVLFLASSDWSNVVFFQISSCSFFWVHHFEDKVLCGWVSSCPLRWLWQDDKGSTDLRIYVYHQISKCHSPIWLGGNLCWFEGYPKKCVACSCYCSVRQKESLSWQFPTTWVPELGGFFSLFSGPRCRVSLNFRPCPNFYISRNSGWFWMTRKQTTNSTARMV